MKRPQDVTFLLAATGLLLCACSSKPDEYDPPTDRPVHVVLEIDRMTGTPPIETIQTIHGQTVSLADIYAPARIHLEIVQGETDLPAPSRLRLGDLHGIMMTHRDPSVIADFHVYCLVATHEFGDDETLGIMFDFGGEDENDLPREAFAVYADVHQQYSDVVAELLLTTAHELAHCFNLHHTDWQGTDFESAATIESYSSSDDVVWRLSDQSVAHISRHPPSLVYPGRLPFATITQMHADRHQIIPIEIYTVVEETDLSRIRRGDVVSRGQAVKAAATTRRSRPSSGNLKLELRAPEDEAGEPVIFERGEPVTLTAVLTNRGDAPIELVPLLDPSYGLLSIEIARDGGLPALYRPPVRSNWRGARYVTLERGEALEADCKVFFGAEGWVLDRPGVYTIEAEYTARTKDGADWVPAEPIRITIAEPAARRNRSAARQLVADNEAGFQAGLYMYFEGGDHLEKGKSRLERVARKYPKSRQAAGARYSLGVGALFPGYDPQTGKPRAPQLEDAQSYLSDVLESSRTANEKIFAQLALSLELDRAGRPDDAEAVRQQAVDRLKGEKPGLSVDDLRRSDYSFYKKGRVPQMKRN